MQDNPRQDNLSQLSATFWQPEQPINPNNQPRIIYDSRQNLQYQNVVIPHDAQTKLNMFEGSGSSFGGENDGIRQKDYDAKKDVKSCCAIF